MWLLKLVLTNLSPICRDWWKLPGDKDNKNWRGNVTKLEQRLVSGVWHLGFKSGLSCHLRLRGLLSFQPPCQRNETSLNFLNEALENYVESEMKTFMRKRTSRFKYYISNKTNEQDSEGTAVVQDLRLQAVTNFPSSHCLFRSPLCTSLS